MEIALGMDAMLYFKKLTEASFDHEETVELIVPDTLPDVAAVVGCAGTVELRSKEAREDSALASGTVEGCVVYTPEGESAPRVIELSVPWNFSADSPGLDTSGKIVVRAELTGLDARVINSRKIVVRAALAASVKTFMPSELSWCGEAGGGVEALKCDCDFVAASAVTEKTFSLAESAAIPASKPPIGRIAGCSATMTADKLSSAGGRSILSGTAEIELLYYAQMSGELTGARISVPYSQSLELSDEEADCECSVMPTGVYVRENAADEETVHTVSVELGAVAQLTARAKKTVCTVSDVYAVKDSVELETKSAFIESMTSSASREASVRETMSSDARVKSVLSCSAAALRPNADGNALRVPVKLKALCLGEDGKAFALEGRAEAAFDCPAKRGDSVCVCVSGVTAEPAAGGVEIRAAVRAEVRSFSETELRWVSAAKSSPDPEAASRPSIVVARAGRDDDLWSLAKRYRASREAIRRLNGLDAEARISPGELLIITKNA